ARHNWPDHGCIAEVPQRDSGLQFAQIPGPDDPRVRRAAPDVARIRSAPGRTGVDAALAGDRRTRRSRRALRVDFSRAAIGLVVRLGCRATPAVLVWTGANPATRRTRSVDTGLEKHCCRTPRIPVLDA